MRTFALRNGDLVLTGSKFGMVEGIARAQQQIGLELREPFGSDRFHREWGSTLPMWIGHVLSSSVPFEIQTEIIRVTKAFILRQTDQVRARANLGLAPVVTPDEMVMQVSDIKIDAAEDQVRVKVTLRTAASTEFSILTTPGSGA